MAVYDEQFYDTIRAGCQSSAAVIVPVVYATVAPTTVVDVGCGEGWFGHEFEQLGCSVTGIDSGDVTPVVRDFIPADLTKPLPALDRCDLAVCLEVAEHLPEWRAASFVSELCELAPVVLFSAAVPGQGGHGHLNEQWPGYWAAHFAASGYTVSGHLRFRFWECADVENWYRMNLLVAAAPGHQPIGWFDGPTAHPFALVHPVLWGHHRGVPAA